MQHYNVILFCVLRHTLCFHYFHSLYKFYGFMQCLHVFVNDVKACSRFQSRIVIIQQRWCVRVEAEHQLIWRKTIYIANRILSPVDTTSAFHYIFSLIFFVNLAKIELRCSTIPFEKGDSAAVF